MPRWPLLIAAALIATPGRGPTLTGQAAYGDWRTDAPGVIRKITPADLPRTSAAAAGRPAPASRRPAGRRAEDLRPASRSPSSPSWKARASCASAPNGDIFVAESGAGQVSSCAPPTAPTTPARHETFAEGLDRPFGIAFYPPGQSAVGLCGQHLLGGPLSLSERRSEGRAGRPRRSCPPAPRGNHWTRDVAFSRRRQDACSSRWARPAMSARAWPRSPRDDRAPGTPATPWARRGQGGQPRRCARLRSATARAARLRRRHPQLRRPGRQPDTNALWCATNERDLLGDNLPPDYVTQVSEGGFYGWPWYYIGDHRRPAPCGRAAGPGGQDHRPRRAVPAPLGPAGDDLLHGQSGAAAFPAEYRGDVFVALHGSWNRAKRTGYKVVRVQLKNGVPTGEYEDF